MKISRFRAEKLQTVLAGFLLILNAYLILDDFPIIGIVIMILGALLLLYFFAVSLRIPRDPMTKPLVVFLEGVGFLATSYISFQLDKVYLPYAYLLAALVCFFGVVKIFRKINREHRKEKNN